MDDFLCEAFERHNDALKEAFERHNIVLEKAYQAGNLGALKDIIYWAMSYKQPLPEWANRALAGLLDDLTAGNKKKLGAWRTWFLKYVQKMRDFLVYDTVKELRGEYHENFGKKAEWKDIYSLAGQLIQNRFDESVSENTIKAAYSRVKKGMESNCGEYTQLHTFPVVIPLEKLKFNKELFQHVSETINAGNSRNKKGLWYDERD